MAKDNSEFIWKRQYFIPQGLPAIIGLFDFTKLFLGEEVVAHGEWDKGWLSIYSRKGLMADVGKKVADQVEHNDAAVKRWMNMVHERGEKLIAFAQSVPTADDLTLDEIFTKIREYFTWFENYQPPLWHSFYVAEAASKAVLKMLRAEGIKNETEVVSRLSKPSSKAHVLKIAEYFSRVSDTSERVKYLKDHFPWIGSADPLLEPYDDKKFHDYAMAAVGSDIDESLSEGRPIKASLLENDIVRVYQECLFIKDKRDEYRRILFYHMHPLFMEISQRLTVPLEDLGLVFPDELERLENDRESLCHEINARKNGLIVEKDASGVRRWEGDEARRLMQGSDESNGEVKELKGISGSPGKIAGVVQIVSLSNLNQFKEGNVLVVVTTNPNYVPAMQKARAVVTDEGGVTCHAAIIARELNKPCVVGTKIATQVLKDGDLIEVDGEQGVVKRLG